MLGQGQGMALAPVLVVEFDGSVRDVLRDIFTDAGYRVYAATTDAAAFDFLAQSPDGVIALCSNKDADHHLSAAFFAHVVADERLASRHQYLMLSTNRSLMPPDLQAHLAQLDATILPKPFDVDTLLARVRESAARLAPTHTHTRIQTRPSE